MEPVLFLQYTAFIWQKSNDESYCILTNLLALMLFNPVFYNQHWGRSAEDKAWYSE